MAQSDLTPPGNASNTGTQDTNRSSGTRPEKVKHLSRVPALLDIFKRLLLPSKLQRNKEIEVANMARMDRAYNHQVDPESFPDDASSIVSYFPMEEEDLKELADPVMFNRLKDDIPGYLIRTLNEREAKCKADAVVGDVMQVTRKRCKDGETMIPLTLAGFEVDFPKIFYDTVDSNSVLPLSFFFPKNAIYIATHIATIDQKKVTLQDGTKVNILDVAKIVAKGKFEKDKANFKADVDMSYAEFCKAGAQMVLFESSRDASMQSSQVAGAWTNIWRDHFGFFTNNTSAMELHRFWKEREIEMRETMLTQHMRYRVEDYFAALEGARMLRACIVYNGGDPDQDPPSNSVASSSRQSGPSGYRDHGRSAGPSNRGRPFQAGSGGARQPAPVVCLECAGKNHTIREHPAALRKLPDGKPVWAKKSADGNLQTPDGKTICINWNTKGPGFFRPCKHGDERVHRTLSSEEFLDAFIPSPLSYPNLAPSVESRPTFDPAIHDRPDLYEKIVTPYDADAFEFLLNRHNLTESYPHLVHNLRHGFPIGNFPPLEHTVILKNHPSVERHIEVVDAYLVEEVTAGRMDGPFTQEEVERILRGPIQVSPLIVAESVQAPGEPNKLRVCRHLSKGSSTQPSVNSFIEKELFPTRFDSTTKMGEMTSPGLALPSCSLFPLGGYLPLCGRSANLLCTPPLCGLIVLRIYQPLYARAILWPRHSVALFRSADILSPFCGADAPRNHPPAMGSRVSVAPEGLEACTEDISKFHRTCPTPPEQKRRMVVQGRDGQLFIDHCIPFGTASASSNAGMIANAIIDIWRAEGVHPVAKYEDDNCVLRVPVPSSPFKSNGYFYAYDKSSALATITSLKVPWHPDKGTPAFHHIVEYLGLGWDLRRRLVYLPEKKRLKHLRRVHLFLTKCRREGCSLLDVQKIHGSLCYITFVHLEGSSRLPTISNFMATFNHAKPLQRRHPNHSMIGDIKWWLKELERTDVVRHLRPPGPMMDTRIFVDASTSWGLGIIIDSRWCAFRLRSEWKSAGGLPGRDICWLETIAVEILAILLEALGFRDCRVLIHSDNQGTIGAMGKGRSPNMHINLSIRRTFVTLSSTHISPSFSYIESALNPADPISRGELADTERHSGGGPFSLLRDLALSLKIPFSSCNSHSVAAASTSSLSVSLKPLPRHTPSVSQASRPLTSPPSSIKETRSRVSPYGSNDRRRSFIRGRADTSRFSALHSSRFSTALSSPMVPTSPKLSLNPQTFSGQDTLRPPVVASQRLLFWKTPFSIDLEAWLSRNLPVQLVLSSRSVALKGLAPSTLTSYGAGLLRFTQYCDIMGISEGARMPASVTLLASFADKAVGFYSGKTVGTWLSGIRCWHVINQATWYGDDPLVKLAHTAAHKAGTGFQKPKRSPVTLAHLRALGNFLDVTTPHHAAIWAAALSAFFGCRRLGEVIISGRGKFSPDLHVTKNMSFSVKEIANGSFSASFDIPWTKTTKQKGGTVILTSRSDELCPVAAFVNHLNVNKGLPESAPLFAYKTTQGEWAALEKPDFLFLLSSIWESKGLEVVSGHSFRIGGTVALLLAGVPPHVVAATGGWTSLSFLTYWRSIADIVSHYTSAAYSLSDIARLSTLIDSLDKH
ncbi:hypothetical protein NP233_g6448 [Leucocoprinus birnbaumii]|uniref:Uncharacterized protein n=1 Tax=Leucocoprinus birnbaumii TaxID=56174 RepID=A0AAD5VTU4_9AGAR|nr:hypothetical protein NP233_g6448 [Leucocoprinus birnbaumii]